MISSEYAKRGFEYLYNINSLNNLEYIFKYGLLSKNKVNECKIKYDDLSNHEVQSIRESTKIGDGIELHDYANLYFNPRNAMMYYLMHHGYNQRICILVISNTVLDYSDSFISDGNAAKFNTRFYSPIEGLKHLDYEKIFIESWYDNDPYIKEEKKRYMFAEALIKDKVYQDDIIKILVPNDIVKNKLLSMNLNIEICVNKHMFFGE